jgi:hypothetical protein
VAGQGTLVEGPGGGQVALDPEQPGQVVEALGGVGVVGAQHPLPDGQGALEEGPGGGQLALGIEQPGQIVEALGGVGVVGAQHPLGDGQGALEEGSSGGQIALVPEQQGQVVEAGGGVGVLGTQHPLIDGQGALGEGPGQPELPARPQVPRDPVQQPAAGAGLEHPVAGKTCGRLHVGQQAGAERPVPRILDLGRKGPPERPDGDTQPALSQLALKGVADHRLDQPVHAQPVALAVNQRVAAQLADGAVQLELVAGGLAQLLGQLAGAICEEAERDVVGGQEGAEAEQGGGRRLLAPDAVERELPGRGHG